MKKTILLLIACFMITMCGCKRTQITDNTELTEEIVQDQNNMKETKLRMIVGDTEVQVEWEDNESVKALTEFVKDSPLTIQMSMYGGFEQVGSIGTSLPRNDVQIVTKSGDIVLYSGNQIVVFYGSNSWAYTQLGHITDRDQKEMEALLGNGDVTITISIQEAQ